MLLKHLDDVLIEGDFGGRLPLLVSQLGGGARFEEELNKGGEAGHGRVVPTREYTREYIAPLIRSRARVRAFEAALCVTQLRGVCARVFERGESDYECCVFAFPKAPALLAAQCFRPRPARRPRRLGGCRLVSRRVTYLSAQTYSRAVSWLFSPLSMVQIGHIGNETEILVSTTTKATRYCRWTLTRRRTR